MGMETLMLGALAGKMIYDKGKKSGKEKGEKAAAASSAQKQAQIDALQKQNNNLQSQMQMNRRGMFADLGFENKKPDGTSGGMLPM